MPGHADKRRRVMLHSIAAQAQVQHLLSNRLEKALPIPPLASPHCKREVNGFHSERGQPRDSCEPGQGHSKGSGVGCPPPLAPATAQSRTGDSRPHPDPWFGRLGPASPAPAYSKAQGEAAPGSPASPSVSPHTTNILL